MSDKSDSMRNRAARELRTGRNGGTQDEKADTPSVPLPSRTFPKTKRG
jgi:hypothetical protein